MRTLTKSALTAVCLLLVAGPALAQGTAIKLNPRIGLYVPLTDLSDGADAPVETAKLNNSLALGLGVELDFAALPFGLRANLDYATSSSVDFEESEVNDTGETTLLAVVGDVVFRPLPRIVVVQPYLFAGGGIKQYDFSWEGATPEQFESEGDGTLHLGGGLDFGIGPLALNAEIGDYISWFQVTGAEESEMQHDVFITAGFSIDMF